MNTVSSFLAFYCLLLLSMAATAQNIDIDKLPMHSLDSIEAILNSKGRYSQAIPYAQRSLDLAKQTGNDSLIAEKLVTLGGDYSIAGPYSKALELYTQALDLRKRFFGEDHPEYIKSLYHLGNAHRSMGSMEQAELLFNQALDYCRKRAGENNPHYGNIINALAIVYGSSGRLEKAAEYYAQSAELAKKFSGEMSISYANSLQNLGSAYRELGRFDEAEKLHFKVRHIKGTVEGDRTPGYGLNLTHLARLYQKMKRYDEAEKLFWQAFDIWQESLGKEHLGSVLNQENLGKLYIEMNRLQDAERCFKNALFINCVTKDSALFNDVEVLLKYEVKGDYLCMETLSNLHLLYKKQYEQTKDKNLLSLAYKTLQVALQLNEKMRNRFTADGDKLRVLKRTGKLSNWAIETAQQIAPDFDLVTLFSYAELNKSALLADASKSERARSLGDLPDSLAQEEMGLQEELSKLKKQEAEAQTAEQKEKVVVEINKVNLKINAFVKSLQNNFPKYHAMKYAQISATASEIQQQINDKTLFLEYFIADSVVYLFALSKQNIRLHPLRIDKDSLKTRIKQLRTALTDYNGIAKDPELAYQNYSKSAFWFYQTLLAPALLGTTAEQLIIVTDGELGHLPFETFLVEKAPETASYADLHYLIKDYDISYNYSATLWKETLKAEPKQHNGQLFAFAASYANAPAKTNQDPELRSLRDALADLPAAKAEVEALAASFAGDFRFGADANEAYFKANAHQYGVVHLAMHGLLNKKQPILSSLAFTETTDSSQDDFLEAWEIAHLKLNADLVVLSACETGYGKFEQGEGVLSLARSFMYAGVPALVVSMWEVNDASTSQIMQLFYQNLSAGQDKAQALRQAKLKYLSEAKGVSAHPAYWSPFVQIGDNRPITLGTQDSNWWKWTLGIIGGIIGGYVLLRLRIKSLD